jgi:hypothetical protein
MQEMSIDMEEIGVFTYSRDDMLVPYLGQQRTAGQSQIVLPFASEANGFSRPPPLLRLYSQVAAASKHELHL